MDDQKYGARASNDRRQGDREDGDDNAAQHDCGAYDINSVQKIIATAIAFDKLKSIMIGLYILSLFKRCPDPSTATTKLYEFVILR